MSVPLRPFAVALAAAVSFLPVSASPVPKPPFSWRTTPIYQMFGDGERLLTDAEVRHVAATTDFLCIEKNHAFRVLRAAEGGAAREIARIKSASPGAKCLFYLNSAYAYPFTTGMRAFGRDPIAEPYRSFLIDDPATGQPARRGRVPFFDVLDPEFRRWWAETAGNYVRDSGADGLFVDQMHGFAHLRPKRRKEVAAAQVELMKMAKNAIGGDRILLLNNGAHIPGLFEVGDAFMFEHYSRSHLTKEAIVKDWELMRRISEAGKSSVWRIGVEVETGDAESWPDERFEEYSKQRLTYHLAVFLIGARPYSYFQYGWGWKLQSGPLVDYPELRKPLGKPLGEAVRRDPDRWVFGRSFERAVVRVDLESGEAKIDWR